MRLERLELVPYTLPFREPYVTARGELRERELLLVRMIGAGAEGLGEAAPLALRGGPGIEQIARELREACWPLLQQSEIAPERIWAALAACRGRGISLQTLAAVDIALHDLVAKLLGVPLWRLLGAESAVAVRCNATLPAGNPASLARLAERWAERGFRTFKLKVGIAGDLRQLSTVREALGPQARIRVDANEAWGTTEAVTKLKEMEAHRIELAEQPVAGLEEMARVGREVLIPLAADESVVEARDARRAVELRACQLATVKLAKTGGISAALQVADELPVYLSSALDGPVGIAAAVHAAQALPREGPAAELAHGLATAELFEGTVAARQLELDGDSLLPCEEPGLGVEIDLAALQSMR
jgi:L-alanine-DL-glutamate epimerase-like enolase superfamily enzyme